MRHRISLSLAAAALAPALALATAGTAGAAPTPEPQRIVPVQLAKAEAGVTAVKDTYIVELKKGVRLKSGLGIAPQRQFSTAVNGFSAKLSAAQVAALQKSPDVVAISQDVYVQNVLDATQTNPPSWGIDRIDQRNLPLSRSFTYNRTGSGVHAYIIDSGVDPSHPNFGGRATFDFNGIDSNNTDCNGHGTHVAGTIGSPINGIGIAGVAPGVELVNLRAGQDSGYFFLGAVVDALTYAADNGIDVVNMSFYVDPWLYNCTANPADTPEQQAEQRTVIQATQRALDYAFGRGVTLISSAGNGASDLGRPEHDGSSPNFPPGNEHDREIDNSCLTMPTEGDGVVAVTSVAPSGRKAYYSDYGIEQADIAAPGGDAYDSGALDPTTMVLAPYPEQLAIDSGDVDPETGEPTTPFVVADCSSGDCSYYQYLQGTSMASPHVTGVAALVVAAKGHPGPGGDHTLEPRSVARILTGTAVDTACPAGDGGLYEYADPIPPSYDAVCEGSAARNGFYGDGIVNALRAVTTPGLSGR